MEEKQKKYEELQRRRMELDKRSEIDKKIREEKQKIYEHTPAYKIRQAARSVGKETYKYAKSYDKQLTARPKRPRKRRKNQGMMFEGGLFGGY